MGTNFFTELAKLNLEQITISAYFKNGTITVAVLPKSKSDDEAAKLTPLTLAGNVQDLDNNFFEKVSKPLENTSEMFTNIEQYEMLRQEKEKETQKAKDLKKEIKDLEDKLKKIVDDKEFNADKEKPKVLKLCSQLMEKDATNKLALKWYKEIQTLTNTTSLFDNI